MSQYTKGVVDVTNGSATVIGFETEWLTNVSVGELFTIVDSNVPYFVGAVVSNTEITLTGNYAGTTETGLSYAIVRDYTINYDLPIANKRDVETATLNRAAFTTIDEVLADFETRISALEP